MNEILGNLRQIVVNDMRNVVDVDSTEATSVATSTWNLPSSNPLSAPVRCDWLRSPCVAKRTNLAAHTTL